MTASCSALGAPSQAVAAVHNRIRRIRQHTGIIEMIDEPVSQRNFEGFEVGSARDFASDLLALSTARWTRQQQPHTGQAEASAGLFLLRTFWQQARHL